MELKRYGGKIDSRYVVKIVQVGKTLFRAKQEKVMLCLNTFTRNEGQPVYWNNRKQPECKGFKSDAQNISIRVIIEPESSMKAPLLTNFQIRVVAVKNPKIIPIPESQETEISEKIFLPLRTLSYYCPQKWAIAELHQTRFSNFARNFVIAKDQLYLDGAIWYLYNYNWTLDKLLNLIWLDKLQIKATMNWRSGSQTATTELKL